MRRARRSRHVPPALEHSLPGTGAEFAGRNRSPRFHAPPGGAAMSVHPSVEPTATVAAAPQTQTGRRGWTTGRTVSLVAGGILGLASLGLLGAGGWATWQTTTQR